ncbi:hypothetical protein [Flavobacterium sp. UMI-01]|uniref:hypothetical protein n=1 Tax=Flavobacterium sp. UMI-01 TaxID=1441053 RepID=UPI001C7CF3BD|nr:hypothetical protein [Flavobacterium sp. UMI-01]GIZ08324.1 hypothetical protein FUMI01_10510 [Flavobacterium sp. UMI-01]
MEEEISELKNKIEDIYSILNSLDEFVKSQSEVNNELGSFIKNLTIGVNEINKKVDFIDENLLSTIKNNNIAHDAYNKINESNQRIINKIISLIK